MLDQQEFYHLLEEKYRQYNTSSFIEEDPVQVPHLFNQKEDIEIAAFLTATLAWGRREQIIINAKKLIEWMDYDPHKFIISHLPADRQLFSKFYYRTFNGEDCMFFLESLQNIYIRNNGLQAAFSCPGNSDANTYHHITGFRKLFFSIRHPQRSQKHVSDPEKNSSCKRLHLFLRWMVRKDKAGVDFGIWNHISPSQLICPLDVHTSVAGRKLGLIQRKQDNRLAAEELTSHLKKFDPADPVKYDFALFGLGNYENF